MFSSFLIALREGLEASLIIGILLATYRQSNNVGARRLIWAGVFSASATAILTGAFLTFTNHHLSDRGEQYFAGITSLIAVGLVTGMVFWMKSNARGLKGELNAKLAKAETIGAFAIFATAFLSVIREGIETALFLFTNAKIVKNESGPFFGLVVGLIAAIVLGTLIYRRSISFNLSRFFTVSGIALLVVAAGVLSHALDEFQSLGLLTWGNGNLWDWKSAPNFLTTILEGTVGIGTSLTVLQFLFWALYILVTLRLYLRKKVSPKA
jgi:high-affinity iron transporter